MIEKYIEEVVKHLPESQREEVRKKLNSRILEQLPSEHTEEDIKNVLTKLGDPKMVAREYGGLKNYLIGPDVYDTYVYVLKIVFSVLAFAIPFAAIITAMQNLAKASAIEIVINIITQTITMGLQGVLNAFGWVTAFFVILERVGISPKQMAVNKWSTDNLSNVNKKDMETLGAITNIIFAIITVIVMYNADRLLGWYNLREEGGVLNVVPLFNQEVINTFMPFIAILALCVIFISILKLLYRKWNIKIALSNLVYNILSMVYVIFFFSMKNLINGEFIELFASKAEFTVEQVNKGVEVGRIAIIGILTVLLLWDTVDGFIKAWKARSVK